MQFNRLPYIAIYRSLLIHMKIYTCTKENIKEIYSIFDGDLGT